MKKIYIFKTKINRRFVRFKTEAEVKAKDNFEVEAKTDSKIKNMKLNHKNSKAEITAKVRILFMKLRTNYNK